LSQVKLFGSVRPPPAITPEFFHCTAPLLIYSCMKSYYKFFLNKYCGFRTGGRPDRANLCGCQKARPCYGLGPTCSALAGLFRAPVSYPPPALFCPSFRRNWLARWLLMPRFQVRIPLSTDIFLLLLKRSESLRGYCSAIKMPAVEFS